MTDQVDIESRLRELVRIGHPDGTVALRWLAQLLGDQPKDEEQVDEPVRDLTVEEVGEHFRGAPSTVRGWLVRGRLRGYELDRRDWRIPPSAIGEYEQRQREPDSSASEEIDSSVWRRLTIADLRLERTSRRPTALSDGRATRISREGSGSPPFRPPSEPLSTGSRRRRPGSAAHRCSRHLRTGASRSPGTWLTPGSGRQRGWPRSSRRRLAVACVPAEVGNGA